MSLRLQDLHTHTTYSDGKTDFRTMVQAAGVYGLDTLAITDHCGPGWEFNARRIAQDCEQARAWARCHLMAGVEAVVTDMDGHLTVEPEMLPHLDLVLCEMNMQTSGWRAGASAERRARAIVDTLVTACRRNPCIRILAHPLNVAGPASIDLGLFDGGMLDDLASACVETRTAFEIMSDQWWWFRDQDVRAVTDQYARIVRHMARRGVGITLSSDAHNHQGLANFVWARQVMRLAGVGEGQIAYIEPPRKTPGISGRPA